MGTLNQYVVQSALRVMEMFNKISHSELRRWRLAIGVAYNTLKPALTGTALYPALAQRVHGGCMLWDQGCQAESHAE